MPRPLPHRTRPSALLRAALCTALVAFAPELPAQGLISGRALLPNSTRPLACVDAALRRTDGTLIATTFTREDGTFEFAAPPAGRYVVAFSTLGMAEAVAPLDSLRPTSDLDRTFAVPLNAVDSLVEHVDANRWNIRFAQLARTSGAPRYRASELENGREGGVVGAIVVRPDGLVDPTLTSILYASAEPFETSLREAFARMRFEPAQFGGQPRCSLLILPYIFELAANGATRSSSYVLGEVGVLAPSVVTPMPEERRGICPPLPVEAEGTPLVYLACQVDREAREARNNARLNWEPAGGEIRANACFRAEARFVVDAAGVPEPGTAVLVSTNNSGFGAAVLAMVPDLRYAPGRLNGRPVRQVVTYRETVGVRVSIQDGIGVGSSTPSRTSRC